MNKYKNLNMLRKAKKVCLIGHIEPDPDAISSMVVLSEFIRDHFKIGHIDLFGETVQLSNNLYSILGEKELIQNVNSIPHELTFDTVVMMDCPNTDRLGVFKPLFEKASQTIVIDHHATNDFSGDLNIVEICSSTCEIVSAILYDFKYNITDSQMGKLYAGMITDTNNFSVGEIKERTFQIAGQFVEHINRDEIYKTYMANTSLKNLKVLSMAIENISSYENDQILITHIDHKTATENMITKNDLCGLINKIATVSTAKLVCFVEPRDNSYYVSMRAKKGFNVAKIAKTHNGGGHVGAAAFSTDLNITEIEKIILADFKKELNQGEYEQIKLF